MLNIFGFFFESAIFSGGGGFASLFGRLSEYETVTLWNIMKGKANSRSPIFPFARKPTHIVSLYSCM
ncbi:hypothetical protein XELAEV_18002693mg [Xenopus laevis]|nr:hypothetical protein XELAEV_18002693mg [Xenopus laevis]